MTDNSGPVPDPREQSLDSKVTSCELTMDDSHDLLWLRRTLDLAKSSRLEGDQPFSAILVAASGFELGRATNTRNRARDIAGHAELTLIRNAWPTMWREFPDATLYASTEPCLMCAGAIGWSRVGRVVYGLSQARLNTIPTSRPPRFAQSLGVRVVLGGLVPPIAIVGPLLEEEALAVHDGFWSCIAE
jgi:tRNA(Arg) A34 adenosine deaminase TadA